MGGFAAFLGGYAYRKGWIGGNIFGGRKLSPRKKNHHHLAGSSSIMMIRGRDCF